MRSSVDKNALPKVILFRLFCFVVLVSIVSPIASDGAAFLRSKRNPGTAPIEFARADRGPLSATGGMELWALRFEIGSACKCGKDV